MLTMPRWSQRTCLPSSIFGPNGYLALCQPKIKRLTLESSPGEETTASSYAFLHKGLARLPCLEYLSWGRLDHLSNFPSVQRFLRDPENQLRELRLVFQEYDEMEPYNSSGIGKSLLEVCIPYSGRKKPSLLGQPVIFDKKVVIERFHLVLEFKSLRNVFFNNFSAYVDHQNIFDY